MTDKDITYRWITQADLERMLDDAFKRGQAAGNAPTPVRWEQRMQGDQRAVVGRAHCLVFESDNRPGQWVWDIRFYDDYSTGYADSEEEAKAAAVNAVRAGVM
jgi:hypothetical protein